MRRPLFAAALFLVTIAALRILAGWAEAVPYGCISTSELSAAEELLITGQVYQKNETSIYLKSAIFIETDASGQSTADSQQEIPIQENVICETENAEEIPLGSYVAVTGQFFPYSRATNPGEFDAAMYYRTIEVGGKLKKTAILAKSEEYWHVRESLYRLKCDFKDRLYHIFPEKEAAVMSALLLGDKSELDSDLKELYKRNGVLHILSISSLHITIIGMTIYRLLRKTGLPVCLCALAGSGILLLYGCMTGFSVSACRAIGMYLIKMAAEVVGRTYDMLTALGVMAALMVLRNPFYLQNSGFLLSFTSVLGIGVVYPLLMPQLPRGDGGDRNASKKKAASGQAFSKRLRQGVTNGLAALAEFGKNTGRALLQSFFASLSITLATLPVQLWFYYEIPVYSVFLNLFVIPFLKPMMITGLLAMLVPGLGGLGLVGRLILGSYEFMCGCFDSFPFHTWNPGCPQVWQIVAYYLLLGGVLLIKRWIAERNTFPYSETTDRQPAMSERTGTFPLHFGRRLYAYASDHFPLHRKSRKKRGDENPERKVADIGPGKNVEALEAGRKNGKTETTRFKWAGGIGCDALLTFAVLLFAIREPAKNSVTFLDVGQGDCILLRTASGENYLFDCGSSSRKNIGKYILLPYLKYNGIRTIDAIFLSHPDADHVNGAAELLALGGENNITVRQLLLPDIEESAKGEQLGALAEAALEAAQKEPVPVGYISAGFGWECGSASFTCLHPEKGFSGADVNSYSECFLVEFREGEQGGFLGGAAPGQGWTLLLTGDVQEKGEKAFFQEIQARDIRGITVLKAAHHGSAGSTPEALLDQLAPLLTVISSGRNNRYGHPHAELLERLEACGTAIIGTAQSGAVTVTCRDGGLLVTGMIE